jgi:serine protease SohB
MIYKRIRVLALARRVPVLCYIEDIATSGGYWIALAADKIFADETSQVGSIGVITRQFGFSGLLERLGIERRVYAHGALKAMNDPYLPNSPDGEQALDSVQRDMAEHFREVLNARRAGRLSATAPEEIGSGRSWTGRQAEALGLVDATGDSRLLLRRELGTQFQTRLFQPALAASSGRPSLLKDLLGDVLAAGM